MSKIKLDGQYIVNLVDSAVHDKIKLKDTSGAGEKRIYIKTTDNPYELNEFFFKNTGGKFLLYKDDLFKYLRDAYIEFNYPYNNYRENIKRHYYDVLKDVYQAPDIIELYFDQTYDSRNRYYLKAERAYLDKLKKYISRICLPRLTKITFVKYLNLDTKECYIKIRPYFFDESYIRSNHPNFDLTGKDVIDIGKEIRTIEKHQEIDFSSENRIANKNIQDQWKRNTEQKSSSSNREWQQDWRSKVLESTLHCAVTKCSEDRTIQACHIKGSAYCLKDLDGNEKNPNNGIMLLPTFHWLFDRGFLTFSDTNKLLLSTHITDTQYKRIGISRNQFTSILNIDDRYEFLKWHRINIYKG